MPDDGGLSLRLTYAQLADARGITKASAERLARNRKWPRVLGNDGVAVVIVPPGQTSPGSGGGSSPGKQGGRRRPGYPPPDLPYDPLPDIRGAVEAAVAPLREQLEHERKRADAAEQQAQALRTELVEARVAERVAVERARMLEAPASAHNAQIERPRRRWWRRKG